MSCSVTNIKIEPVELSLEAEEKWQVTTVADVASSLDGKYFLIQSGSGAGFYVWMDIGAAADPAPSGRTGIPVTVSPNATAATIAGLVSAAVTANANFYATVSGTVVTIECVAKGDAGDFADVDTGFSFQQCTDGLDLDLGLIDGDIEVGFEETNFEVTAHSKGLNILAELRQANNVTLGFNLLESDSEKYKAIFKSTVGGADTPSMGTEVYGIGSSRQGSNTFVQARRLVMHPVSKAANDYSEDVCVWKAYVKPETMVFSGENPKTLSLTVGNYLDDSKPEEISRIAFGDWTQYLPV